MYYQNYDNGLAYTEEEARRFTLEQIDNYDLDLAMAAMYRLIDLYPMLPEEEQTRILTEAVSLKMRELFTTKCDEPMLFAHDCPGHEV